MKAFIVNRVGDFGFALGIFLVFVLTGSVGFDAIFPKIAGLANTKFHFIGSDFDAMTLACLLLFMGAMGKSAQFLLHTWLPDAMEGPTPVSALIHAATMVTAGVFMVARLSPLFEQAPAALTFVTIVGATTDTFSRLASFLGIDPQPWVNSTTGRIDLPEPSATNRWRPTPATPFWPPFNAAGMLHALPRACREAAPAHPPSSPYPLPPPALSVVRYIAWPPAALDCATAERLWGHFDGRNRGLAAFVNGAADRPPQEPPFPTWSWR
jgi:hypothetical protein